MLAWCVQRLLLPLLLAGAASALLLLLAWRLLLRRRLPRWLQWHITGLQILLNPQLALRIQSVGLESASLRWRGGRLCWVVRGLRASLLLREGAVPKQQQKDGKQQQQQQQQHVAGVDTTSLAHDAAAGTFFSHSL